MEKDIVLKNANEVLEKSRHLDALFSSKGWEIYCQLLEKEVEALKDITEIKTIQDLKANQKAVKIWKNISNKLLSIKDAGSEATNVIEKLKE